MEYVIETNNLSKTYGSINAVNSVNLRVKQGEIYGFLGLNGAGKTTTIRMLLGMIRPSEGNVKVLGQVLGPGRSGPWAQVGHLVESPSAYPDLTVRENLDIARRLHGLKNSNAVDDVMESLSIASYSKRKAGALSLGNLQRLGLARAMIHHPSLLILDEPANGLDPAGVVEIRELIANLAKNGVTVFMSSHILTEVDKLATRIGIIHKGRMIEDLDANKLEQFRARRLKIKVRDFARAHAVLTRENYSATITEDSIFVSDTRALETPEKIACLLVNADTPPTHLAVEQQNLEEHFMQLTGSTK
ncbi:MAG TPA: ATP-binding cassette domain-containing protein [Anaerolineales bacterium]|nr:ATP-binding cassette domain-containing protein [Anaerolineales bacterium]HNB86009.1 ATP-binding cassette domain-containing protein [Anaerolineales bacterium]HND91136.1 ATP-binding cassette domain-containing protein [Anaerolineales bacterium]HNF36009.1 ATP-binding cassette domain-containing protein [Anaerolineales bacterium]